MEISRSIEQVRAHLKQIRDSGQTIGFVPTMGALHHGHLSLISAAKSKCDFVIASIFVNPAQFNKQEDLTNYPRTIEEDIIQLEKCGCDSLFLPEASEIYPSTSSLTIEFDSIASELEGKFRPGHFNGVGLVVTKLFNITKPDHAFFGQKDLQQYFVIKTLRDELNFPVELTMVPTVREKSGLAMSSRNMRLNRSDLDTASLIFRSLTAAREQLLNDQEIDKTKAMVSELFSASERLSLEYFEVVSTETFKPLEQIKEKEKVALCLAAEIGGVRLIDNLMLIS